MRKHTAASAYLHNTYIAPVYFVLFSDQDHPHRLGITNKTNEYAYVATSILLPSESDRGH